MKIIFFDFSEDVFSSEFKYLMEISEIMINRKNFVIFKKFYEIEEKKYKNYKIYDDPNNIIVIFYNMKNKKLIDFIELMTNGNNIIVIKSWKNQSCKEKYLKEYIDELSKNIYEYKKQFVGWSFNDLVGKASSYLSDPKTQESIGNYLNSESGKRMLEAGTKFAYSDTVKNFLNTDTGKNLTKSFQGALDKYGPKTEMQYDSLAIPTNPTSIPQSFSNSYPQQTQTQYGMSTNTGMTPFSAYASMQPNLQSQTVTPNQPFNSSQYSMMSNNNYSYANFDNSNRPLPPMAEKQFIQTKAEFTRIFQSMLKKDSEDKRDIKNPNYQNKIVICDVYSMSINSYDLSNEKRLMDNFPLDYMSNTLCTFRYITGNMINSIKPGDVAIIIFQDVNGFGGAYYDASTFNAIFKMYNNNILDLRFVNKNPFYNYEAEFPRGLTFCVNTQTLLLYDIDAQTGKVDSNISSFMKLIEFLLNFRRNNKF